MSLSALLRSLPIPIIQAPMVGASSSPMALAVSAAGGMGVLAGGAWAPETIKAEVAAFRAQTGAPFGVNLLMAPAVAVETATLDAALARLAPWYAELGLAAPERPNSYAPDFEAQFAALARSAPPVASFTFGLLRAEQVAALQAAGTLVIGTATNVAEARAWAEVGADGVCAQGFEAGGHRGHFLGEVETGLVGTMALTALIRQAVDLPLIAAGGVMDGRGVAAALTLGADAVQMGTAFLLADQAATSAPWRKAVAEVADDATRLTRAFTGRHARGIENRFMRDMAAVQQAVPAYPVQNRLTQPLRAAAAARGEAELISLWAGQGVRLATGGEAGALVRKWWREAGESARRTAARTGDGAGDP